MRNSGFCRLLFPRALGSLTSWYCLSARSEYTGLMNIWVLKKVPISFCKHWCEQHQEKKKEKKSIVVRIHKKMFLPVFATRLTRHTWYWRHAGCKNRARVTDPSSGGDKAGGCGSAKPARLICCKCSAHTRWFLIVQSGVKPPCMDF